MGPFDRTPVTRAATRLAITFAAFTALEARAAESVWTGNAPLTPTTLWTAPGNWSGNAVPPAANDVRFGTGFASSTTINVFGFRTANSFIIDTATTFTLVNTSGGALTLTSGDITRTAASANAQTLSTNIDLAGNGDWNIQGSGTLSITGTIGATNPAYGIDKTGTGNLSLSGAFNVIHHLGVNGGGVVTLAGGTTSLINNGTFGVGANSTLVVQGGATFDASGAGINAIDGNNAALFATGAGTRLRSGQQFIVGNFQPNARFTLQNNATADGLYLISGANAGSSGTVVIQSGATSTHTFGILALLPGSTGNITVTGANTTWNPSHMGIGGASDAQNGGTGMLNVTEGGAITVSGETRLWNNASSLRVSRGTYVTQTLTAAPGTAPAVYLSDPSTGPALTIGSGNTTFTFAGRFLDGDAGPGTLRKIGAGTLTLTGGSAATGTTLIAGGTLTQQGGASASGYLVNPDTTLNLSAATISPGFNAIRSLGTVNYQNNVAVRGGFLRGTGGHIVNASGAAFTGTTLGADATLTQLGPATLTNFTASGALDNAATLTWDGGAVTPSGTFAVGSTATVAYLENAGTIDVLPGATLNNTAGRLTTAGGARLTVASGAAVNLQNATSLDLRGGLLVNNGTVTGTTNVHFNGLATGTGTFGPVNLFDNGRFAPGASAAPAFQPAAPTASAASFAPDTTFAVEIGGKVAGTSHDKLTVTGPATLAGTLDIATANNFHPAPLDAFTVLSFTSRTGRFAAYTGTAIDNPAGTDLAYAPVYSATDLKLIATLPGDATLDANVDFNDLVRLAQNYNVTVSGTTDNWWQSGDFNYDGKADFNDLVLLAQHYNQSALPTSPRSLSADFLADFALAQSSVPEPTTLPLLLATLPLLRRRAR